MRILRDWKTLRGLPPVAGTCFSSIRALLVYPDEGRAAPILCRRHPAGVRLLAAQASLGPLAEQLAAFLLLYLLYFLYFLYLFLFYGWVISAGFTSRSKSSPERYPSFTAASRRPIFS